MYGKINLYSHFIDCGFKKIDKTIFKKELSYFLESLNYL